MSTTTKSSAEREKLAEEALDRYRSWADLSFHYGFSWDQLYEMPNWLRRVYIEELPRLLAEKLSHDIDASSFSNMKPDSQRAILRRIARATKQKPKKFKDEQDMKGSFDQSAMPIGIKEVTVSKSKMEDLD